MALVHMESIAVVHRHRPPVRFQQLLRVAINDAITLVEQLFDSLAIATYINHLDYNVYFGMRAFYPLCNLM